MDNILEEASDLVQCKECPWYKTCVTPMRFNADDLKKEMQQVSPTLGINTPGDTEMRNLFGNMAAMVQSLMLEGCPIFIKRLKTNQDLAIRIKHLMQTWGQEK